MRDLGIPKLLTWRWAPCAALVLGSLSFVGFVSLVVPEHIGGLVDSAGKASSLRLGNSLARSRTTTPESPDHLGESTSEVATNPAPPPNAVTRIAQRSGDNYPRRGFSPPLDRPEPPAPPPAGFTAAAVPPPAEAAPPPPPAPEPTAPQADLAQAVAPTPPPAP